MASDKNEALTTNLKQWLHSMQVQVEQLHRTTQFPEALDIKNLQLVAIQLASSIQQISRRVHQLEDDHTNLLALAEISQVVNSSLDLNAVLEIVMDTIVQLTGAERGFLMLFDGENDSGILVPRIARNWEKESLDSSEFAISQTVIQRVISSGEPVLTTNAQEDPRFDGHASIISYNLRSILCVPLKAKEKVTGVIYADNRIKTGIFTEAKRNLLSVFANQAAVAIENARLFASVQRTLNEVTELKILMDNLLASITSGVITADNRNRVLLANKASETILGKPGKNWVGQKLEKVLPDFSRDLIQQVKHVREKNHSLVGLEYSACLPDRGQVVLSFSLAPLKDAVDQTQGVAIVMEDLSERKRLEAQQSLFKRMVSPAVIAQLNPDELESVGRRAQITTLFADVRGYTAFGERYDPEQLVSILNRYLSVAAAAVLDEEGTIDKFLGDAIMAWFNAPIPQTDHTLRAVRAALAMVHAVNSLHRDLDEEFHLSFGVGIHYGEAVLGLIGNEMRLDYTAIGDSVNTAKRIQENARGGQILISKEAYELVAGHINAQPFKAIRAKGKSQSLRVFEVLGLK